MKRLIVFGGAGPVTSALIVLTELTLKTYGTLRAVLVALTGIFIMQIGVMISLWAR